MPEPVETAWITGASSGIGAAFARQLAEAGYHLVLVARREDRLQALADELQAAHGATAEVLAADLTRDAHLAHLEGRLKADAPTLLINNAGFGTRGHFIDLDITTQLNMVKLHADVMMRLMRAAVPGMVARKQGFVINVASVAGFSPSPGSATYSATKSFMIAFSEAVAGELQGTGVTVQVLCPGFTYTEFHDQPTLDGFERSSVPKALWLSADRVVSESLRELKRGTVVCIPAKRYKALAWVSQTRLGRRLRSGIGRRLRGIDQEGQ